MLTLSATEISEEPNEPLGRTVPLFAESLLNISEISCLPPTASCLDFRVLHTICQVRSTGYGNEVAHFIRTSRSGARPGPLSSNIHLTPPLSSVMARSSVFLVGATGETGKHILEALVDESFVGIFPFSDLQKGDF